MRGLAIALVIAALGGVAHAQPQHLDESQIRRGAGEAPEIILLTFGEGFQIFEKFGHAALCIHYPSEALPPQAVATGPVHAFLAPIADKTGIPIEQLPLIACINYGVTNFNEGPVMIWHFLRTEQKFWADTESMISMVRFYSGKDSLGKQLQEDRDTYVQRLPLKPEQARSIEQALLGSLEGADHEPCRDHESAGCYYYYDHFFNNCTTRLRDMIDGATGGQLAGDSKTVDYPLTFRQMGRRGLAELPPLIAAADYLMGRQLDDTPTLWQAMFHPDVLRDQVRLKLGVEPVLIYKRTGPDFPQDGSSGRFPMLCIAIVFALPLGLARWRKRGTRLEKAALIWSTFYLVLWGALIYVLVSISSIPGVRWNEAVFVMTPFDIVLPFLGEAKRRRYAQVRVAILMGVSLLCGIGVFHQPLWIPILTAFMPLAMYAFDVPPAATAKSAAK